MTLEEKLKNLPTAPGVYIHKNAEGKIIYVGKAKNLKNRVRSYFQSNRGHDRKTREVFNFFRECDRANVETIYCETVDEKGIGAALMDRLKRASDS